MKHLTLAFALCVATPALAGSLSDLLMAPGLLAGAPDGVALVYERDRATPSVLPGGDVADGRLVLTALDGARGRALALSRQEGGATQPVAEFPASGANPVLLYFLETTARSMADATGGSPFYIRNRMREAFGAAEAAAGGAVEEVTLRPFVADRNRGRMGVFADLALTLRFDPDEPARILELSADTAAGEGGYHDRLVLIAED